MLLLYAVKGYILRIRFWKKNEGAFHQPHWQVQSVMSKFDGRPDGRDSLPTEYSAPQTP